MRLGAYHCRVGEGTLLQRLYGSDQISERHRHRFEVNNDYRDILTQHGMVLSGTSPDGKLVEAVELPGHRFFVGVQYHPEFKKPAQQAAPSVFGPGRCCTGGQTMRNYELELKNRIGFIRDCLKSASAQGIVYGNSGGKDSALTGILCKLACENTVGLIMPCRSRRSYEQDRRDAEAVAAAFGIETRMVDLQGGTARLGRCLKQGRFPHGKRTDKHAAAPEDGGALRGCRQ